MTRKYKRFIRTLDPTRIRPGDFIDISGIAQPALHVGPITSPQGSSAESPESHQGMIPITFWWKYGSKNTFRAVPFPLNTHGYLYYHPPADDLPQGHIRFRLIENPTESGTIRESDLLHPNKSTWYLPIDRLYDKKWDLLRALLLADRLVEEMQFEEDKRTIKLLFHPQNHTVSEAIVEGLGKPFVVDFGKPHHTAFVPHQGRPLPATFQHPLARHRSHHGATAFSLFTRGKAMCCFEPSLDPWNQDFPHVSMRLLDCLDEFTPASWVKEPPNSPDKGEFFLCGQERKRWELGTVYSPLRKLWDASALELFFGKLRRLGGEGLVITREEDT